MWLVEPCHSIFLVISLATFLGTFWEPLLWQHVATTHTPCWDNLIMIVVLTHSSHTQKTQQLWTTQMNNFIWSSPWGTNWGLWCRNVLFATDREWWETQKHIQVQHMRNKIATCATIVKSLASLDTRMQKRQSSVADHRFFVIVRNCFFVCVLFFQKFVQSTIIEKRTALFGEFIEWGWGHHVSDSCNGFINQSKFWTMCLYRNQFLFALQAAIFFNNDHPFWQLDCCSQCISIFMPMRDAWLLFLFSLSLHLCHFYAIFQNDSFFSQNEFQTWNLWAHPHKSLPHQMLLKISCTCVECSISFESRAPLKLWKKGSYFTAASTIGMAQKQHSIGWNVSFCRSSVCLQ